MRRVCSRTRPLGRHPRPLRVATAVCALATCAALLAGCGDDGDDGGDKRSPSATIAEPSKSAPSSPNQPGDPSGSGRLTEDQSERKALIPMAKVGYAKAADTAVAKVPGGRLADLELKGSGGGHPSGDDGRANKTNRVNGINGVNGVNGVNGINRAGSPSPTMSGQPKDAEWIATVAAKDGTAHTVRIDAASGKVLHSAAEADQDADDKRELAQRIAKAKQTPQQAAKVATGKKNGTVSSIELDDNDAGTLLWSVDVVTPKDWNKTTYDVDATTGKVTREHVDRD
ncbi:PepSY domain-containing protein [Streptomyces zagrosensis]|uniref:Putative membrane protein YkoI n=1 Tax=Streptomyces zagrosensis TaxID=1042984 RepID=A0A7W9Q3R0_9ACTN|nr:PepSY domain-containing protein [Streptomyces zagrosensis]MBB5933083.1 putative membrane protein YkoI [Streptomyces zagrosensis]